MIPKATIENFNEFNLGNPVEINQLDDQLYDPPKELTNRNPPFDIELEFDTYRLGKEYKSKLSIITSFYPILKLISIIHSTDLF